MSDKKPRTWTAFNPLPVNEILDCFVIDLACPSGLRYSTNQSVPERYRGRPAGCKRTNRNGYQFYHVQIKRRHIIAHRVVYFLAYGKDPLNYTVDHIDRNSLNNHPLNLRLATTVENVRNQGGNKRNTSGYKGVYWNKNIGRWQASISIDKRLVHLGMFSTAEEAAAARNEAELRVYKEFSPLFSKAQQS